MTTTNTNDILVMSYNISFEAMTNNPHGSAGALGAKCHPVSPGSRLTLCAKNMADLIDKIPSSLQRQNFDFVGFQEASRWNEMQSASTILSQLKSYGSKYGRSEMVSFFDQTKYKLIKDINSGFDYDRPFQILVLSEIKGTGGVIFLNVHCPHHLPGNNQPYTWQEFSKHTEAAIQKLALTDQEKNYRIICVGDFNETQWNLGDGKLEPKTFMPFGPNYIKTDISIQSTPFTCCQGNGVWENHSGQRIDGWRGGDYIFDSKQAADPKVPSIYPANKLLSDHLPVIALLPE